MRGTRPVARQSMIVALHALSTVPPAQTVDLVIQLLGGASKWIFLPSALGSTRPLLWLPICASLAR